MEMAAEFREKGRPRLIDRVIRQVSFEEYKRIHREASDRFLAFDDYVNLRCDELQREAAARMLAQVRFERSGA
jgi:hypothetical protein